MSAGERGPTGDHGQDGKDGRAGPVSAGARGATGERGPVGDHGRDGRDGEDGLTGRKGDKGDTGAAYSSWITRNLVRSYCLLAFGVMVALGATIYTFDQSTARIDRVASEACATGNLRSDLQRDGFLESQRLTQTLDLQKLLGIDAAQEMEFRRLSGESTERRIAALPYVNCQTGQRTHPTTTTQGAPR